MLHSLCHPDSAVVAQEIMKVSDSVYRYNTPFYVVINDMTGVFHEGKHEDLFKIGDNGERWLFSLLIIKENGKWVIDDIDKYRMKPQDLYDPGDYNRIKKEA